jgi:hypothetical protein
MGLVSLIRRLTGRAPALERPAIWGPEDAADFLKVGRFTLSEWLSLSPMSRQVILAVEANMKAEELATIGLASQSPEAAAEVMAKADGGAAREDIVMSRALGDTVEKLRRAL